MAKQSQQFSKAFSSDFFWALLFSSFFAVLLSFIRFYIVDSTEYWFLLWNLLLAWVPLGFAWLLYVRTPKGLRWSWLNFGLSIGWLLFLPNAFYLVSDFIHLTSVDYVDTMYDVALFAAYTWAGMIVGFTSLFLLHVRAVQRFGRRAHWLPVAVLFLCSFAIYLGRYLRWNSWDVVTNPFGLLFDVSETIINPVFHGSRLSITLVLFGFLGVQYLVIWAAVRTIATSTKTK